MAIRFTCPACGQPIEVDDEWADQQVGCPYCKRVVSAPSTSTMDVQSVPTASTEAGDAFVPPSPAPGILPDPTIGVAPPVRRHDGQPLGIFAFIAAAGAAAAMMIWLTLFSGWLMQNIDPEILEGRDPAETQRVAQELFVERGSELQQFSLFPAAAALGGLCAIALAIASLIRNDSKKTWPILAILIGVFAVPCGCFSLLIPFMTLP